MKMKYQKRSRLLNESNDLPLLLWLIKGSTETIIHMLLTLVKKLMSLQKIF